eukprot:12433782-Prorocentrum_lima.AAC.1
MDAAALGTLQVLPGDVPAHRTEREEVVGAGKPTLLQLKVYVEVELPPNGRSRRIRRCCMAQ